MAEEAKSKGNAAFEKRDYRNAIRHYSDGIALDPANPVLYSNRSAAHAALEQWPDAFTDAAKTVELNSEWPRGYLRMGAARLGLGLVGAAVHSFKQGLSLDPNDEALKRGYKQAEAEARRMIEPLEPHALGDVFDVPQMWERLTSDATTGAFAKDSDFVEMMGNVQRDCFKIEEFSEDPRFLVALGALLNVNFRAASPDNSTATAEGDPPSETPVQADHKTVLRLGMKEYAGDFGAFKLGEETGKETPSASASASTSKDATRTETALTLEAYSTRAACSMKLGEFSEALKDAEKCIELEPKSPLGYWRKGDALVCMEEYDQATGVYMRGLQDNPTDSHLLDGLIKCTRRNIGDQSVEESKASQDEAVPEPTSDSDKENEAVPQPSLDQGKGKKSTPAAAEQGGSLGSFDELDGKDSQDELAKRVSSFKKERLMEELQGEKVIQAALEEMLEEIQIDDVDGAFGINIFNTVKTPFEGDVICWSMRAWACPHLVRLGDIADGYTNETESGKRAIAERLRDHCTNRLESNPEKPKLYSNRSMCHVKLGNFHDALKDADRCIELDPFLWIGYHRKGQVLFRLKESDAAVYAYMQGLDKTRNNGELFNAFQKHVNMWN